MPCRGGRVCEGIESMSAVGLRWWRARRVFCYGYCVAWWRKKKRRVNSGSSPIDNVPTVAVVVQFRPRMPQCTIICAERCIRRCHRNARRSAATLHITSCCQAARVMSTSTTIQPLQYKAHYRRPHTLPRPPSTTTAATAISALHQNVINFPPRNG